MDKSKTVAELTKELDAQVRSATRLAKDVNSIKKSAGTVQASGEAMAVVGGAMMTVGAIGAVPTAGISELPGAGLVEVGSAVTGYGKLIEGETRYTRTYGSTGTAAG